MGFSLQDVIQGALQDVSQGAGYAGTTLQKNLDWASQNPNPLMSSVGNIGNAVGVPIRQATGHTITPQEDQSSMAGATQVFGLTRPATGASEADALPISLATTKAANVAANTTRQAIKNVAKAHQAVTDAYTKSPYASQIGTADLAAPLQLPAKAASTKTPLPAITNPAPFQNFDDVTTKVLNKLEGRAVIPRGELIGMLNTPGIKESEKSIINSVLSKYDTQHLQTAAISKAYQDTMQNGGATINTMGQTPTSGVAFSPYKDTETIVPKDTFDEGHIQDFVNKHADKLNQPGHHIGLWEDNGNIYMDISQVGEPTAQTLQKAMDAKQLAAYDLGTQTEIPLGKIKAGKYNPLYEATNHPYLNGGQEPGANPSGNQGSVPQALGKDQEAGKSPPQNLNYKIPVQQFANDIHEQLMPLTKGPNNDDWSEYSMGARMGDSGDYSANVYQSPYEVESGQSHFHDPNYFAHVRREDFPGEITQPKPEDVQAFVDKNMQGVTVKPIEHQGSTMYAAIDADGNRLTAYRDTPEGVMQAARSGMTENALHLLRKEAPGVRNIQEIQSDLYQHNNYKDELGGGGYDPQKDMEQGQSDISYINSRIAEMQQKMKEEPENRSYIKDRITSYQEDLVDKQQKMQQLQGEIAKYGSAPNAGELIKQDRLINRLQNSLVNYQDREAAHPGEFTTEVSSHQKEIADAKDKLNQMQTPEHLAQIGRKAQDLTTYKQDNWWQRIIRQEQQSAAREGKTALRFPTGDTAAKIEGYVEADGGNGVDPDLEVGDTFEHPYEGGDWTVLEHGSDSHLAAPSEDVNSFDFHEFKDNELSSKLDNLRYDLENNNLDEYDLERVKEHFTPEEWETLTAETNPDQLPLIGSEKVNNLKNKLDDALEQVAQDYVDEEYPHAGAAANYLSDVYRFATRNGDTLYTSESQPQWVDTGIGPNDNIYNQLSETQQRVHEFYDKDLRKYLQKLHGENLQEIQDDNGNTWLEVPITDKHKGPVEAYMLAPGIAGGGLVANHQQQTRQ